jgi:hypothetical protein
MLTSCFRPPIRALYIILALGSVVAFGVSHLIVDSAAAETPIASLGSSVSPADSASRSRKSIWDRDNLVAWEAAPYDSKKRSPEERAQMFERLGIKHYAYLSSTDPWESMNDVNTSQHNVDAEIEAMQAHSIDILAWYFWVNAADPGHVPLVRQTLESFKRHHIHPQIWVTNSFADWPRTAADWARYLPKGLTMPMTDEELAKYSSADKALVQKAIDTVEKNDSPKTPEELRRRINREAARIKAFVELAVPYGCQVNIYNHRAWFGMMDNELAILRRLSELGIHNVGMVYNFSHSRDDRHDDSQNFPQLWRRIRSHVVAVNVAGLAGIDDVVYPSQGNRERSMMKTIQESGWQGPIGLLVLWKSDDTEVELRNAQIGIDWVAADLRRVGSGGPPPQLGR